MKLKDMISYIEQLSPKKYAEEWDNVGLLLGDDERDVHRIMIALDATDYVVEQAVKQKVDLVLTHHPMIFKPVKQINNHSMVGRRILKLASNNIAYYAMHTNFDIMGGMASLAAEKLELLEAVPLDVTAVEDGKEEGIGRVGYLKNDMKIADIATNVKEKFGLKKVILYGNKTKEVRKIAISPGSGKSEIENAIKKGAELLITGDIGHHEGIDAVDQGLMILDATHYGLEHIFIDFMADYLLGLDMDDFDIVCMDTGSPIEIL